MGLTRLAIYRPLVILMLILAVGTVGAISYTRLGADLWPDVNFPTVSVVTVYPGAGPESVESQITRPIEDAVSGLSNLDYIMSTSAEGVSYVNVVFTDRANMDAVAVDVERKVSAIRGNLPADARAPSIAKSDTGALPIMNLALSGGRPLDQLFKLADEQISPRLTAVDGVASVSIVGGLQREISVKVDQSRLRAYGLSLLQINQALAQENVDIPGGSLEEQGRAYNLRLNALVRSPEHLRDLIVAATPGGSVYLRDVAVVEDGFKKQTRLQRANGQEAVGILITKQSNANTIKVTDGVKKALAGVRPTLPADTRLDVVTDASIFTRAALDGVQTNLIEAVILTGLVLLLFLHAWRSTLIVLLAIPTSLIATFGVMYVLGFTLNMMSTMALALTVGILVDDSIVVLENIFRHLELGDTPFTAALKGRSEIGLAAIAITLVDVVVYAPIAFMGDVVGQYFRQFGLVIGAATLFSLFVSFTLTPMLAARWLRPTRPDAADTVTGGRGDAGTERQGDAERERRGEILQSPCPRVPASPRLSLSVSPSPRRRVGGGVLVGFGDAWERGYDRLVVAYGGLVRHALRWRWLVVAIGIASFAAGVSMVPLGLLKTELLPDTDQGELTVALEMPPGTPLTVTSEAARKVEKRLAAWPEVDRYFTSVGVSSGYAPDQPRFARIALKLTDRHQRQKSVDQLSQEARHLGDGIPGLRVRAQVPSFLGVAGQPIQAIVQGDDSKTLGDLAARVEDLIRKTPGTADVASSGAAGQPEVAIEVDRQRAADFGLTAAQAAAVLRTSVAGTVVTQYRPDAGKGIDVRVIAADADRASVARVAAIPLVTPRGAQIQLGQIAEIKEAAGPSQILRRNRQRVVILGAALEGKPLGEVSEAIQGQFDKLAIPPGYQVKLGGMTEASVESFGQLYQALALSILLMYMLMVALFESLLYPFIVMLSLPLAIVGALGGLVLTGNNLSMVSMIGMIMLMGLVGKNAILLVDYTNTLRARGLARNDALVEAGKTRLRPILMTTAAMVLAMTPLALKLSEGAEIRSPMAIVVIGGLLTSTLLTLVLIPAVYTLFDDLQRLIFRRSAFAPTEPSTPTPVPAGGSE